MVPGLVQALRDEVRPVTETIVGQTRHRASRGHTGIPVPRSGDLCHSRTLPGPKKQKLLPGRGVCKADEFSGTEKPGHQGPSTDGGQLTAPPNLGMLTLLC